MHLSDILPSTCYITSYSHPCWLETCNHDNPCQPWTHLKIHILYLAKLNLVFTVIEVFLMLCQSCLGHCLLLFCSCCHPYCIALWDIHARLVSLHINRMHFTKYRLHIKVSDILKHLVVVLVVVSYIYLTDMTMILIFSSDVYKRAFANILNYTFKLLIFWHWPQSHRYGAIIQSQYTCKHEYTFEYIYIRIFFWHIHKLLHTYVGSDHTIADLQIGLRSHGLRYSYITTTTIHSHLQIVFATMMAPYASLFRAAN